MTWVAPDGLPARIVADFASQDPADGHLKYSADLSDWGVAVDVDPPPARLVTSQRG